MNNRDSQNSKQIKVLTKEQSEQVLHRLYGSGDDVSDFSFSYVDIEREFCSIRFENCDFVRCDMSFCVFFSLHVYKL